MEPIWAEGNGFRALVESYAVEPAPPARPPSVPLALGCLALVGGRDAVRAILAHALNHGLLDLVGAARTIRVWLGHESAGWALRLTGLPGDGAGRRQSKRATHGLVLPKTALLLDDPLAVERFTLVVPPAGADWPAWEADGPLAPPPDGERVYVAFGHQLQARVTRPFHPDWTAWLWRHLVGAEHIQRLTGRGPQVFRCTVPAHRLDQLIRQGCTSGELAALMEAEQDIQERLEEQDR